MPLGRALRRQWARIMVGLVITLLVGAHVFSVESLGLIEHLDRLAYDIRVRLNATKEVDQRVVIVDIDEASLAGIGRWPWGRDVVATLLDKLFDRYGARIVAFDVVFSEPDHSSGLYALDLLAKSALRDDDAFRATVEQIRPALDHDAQFAKALSNKQVVLGFYVSNDPDARNHGRLPNPALPAGAIAPRSADFYLWRGYSGNLSSFQDAAQSAGHFNVLTDDDGVSRRVPMVVAYRGQYHESLSLAVLRRMHPDARVWPLYRDPIAPGGMANPLEALQLGSLRIPVDHRGAALIPFRGPRGSFNYISAVDLYENLIPAQALEGKIVIVGTSAPGLYDLRATPVAGVFPRVEIHANLISGILDQRIKSRSVERPWIEQMAILGAGIVLAILLPFVSPLRAVIIAGVIGVAFGLYAELAWSHFNEYVPLAPPFVLIGALLASNVLYGYFAETRSRRNMARLFGEYVPPELVLQMAEAPEKYTGEASNEVLTIMFGDLRNFTSIAETLDPTALRRLLNEYFTEVTLVIHEHRGTVDKYLGDGVMAFWGAPLHDAEHARNAVRAALVLQEAVRRAERKLPFTPSTPLSIGVGINTGLVSVGDMGSRLRREYTVLGDPVNLAARLESLTKYYHVEIILGAQTRDLIPDLVCRELDRVRVKGKEEVVSIFEPLGFAADIGDARAEELILWGHMLSAYRARQWDEAEHGLSDLAQLAPKAGLYALYASRITYYRRKPPPPEWDAVTVFDRK